MKRMKYLSGLAALALCAALVLCACGGEPQQTETGSADHGTTAVYTVSVTDALGNPCTDGIIVQFLKDGQQAAMQVVGADGTASKELERGDYTVALQFTDGGTNYEYDASAAVLTAEVTEGRVELAGVPAESRPLVAGNEEYTAWYVSAGCTKVELNGGRSYFLFMPDESGTYEFSVAGSDAAIGYYGAPHFVQSVSAAEVTDNRFSLSIKSEMISDSTAWVVGLDGEGSCTLCIIRTGDPQWGVEDEPWTVYEPTVAINPYELPAGASVQDFDLTAATDAYTLVLSEADGFYHLNSADGPLVLVRLGSATKYLDPLTTVAEKSNVCKYFYDENGGFIKKETYNQCLMAYFECMDGSSGLYPLTEDLKYILQQRGDYYGWYDSENRYGYLFMDANRENIPGINGEIGWLFACCYIEN